MGLVTEKLNRDHMESVAKKAGVTLAMDMSTEDIAKALQVAYRALPPSKLSGCDTCHGESPSALPGCAFCGELDDPKSEEPNPAKKVTTRKLAPSTNGAANGHVNGTSTEIVVAVPMPIEEAKKSQPSKFSKPKDLDAAVQGLLRIKGEQAATCWDFGKYVYEYVYAGKLWMQRLAVDGKPAYKSFAAWVRAEAGVSESYVFTAMEVARSFTREEASQLGSKHLTTLVGAPKEDRQALLLKAKEEGLTVRQTQQLVDDTRKAKGGKVNKNDKGKTMPQGGRPLERIALTLPPNRLTLPLMKKGTDKPARRLADNPVITIEGMNGVVLVLSITENAKGDLVAVGTPKRAE